MQKVTATTITEIAIQKFDQLVYILIDGKTVFGDKQTPFCVTREWFDKKEKRCKGNYQWLIKLKGDSPHIYVAWSKRFLKSNYGKGMRFQWTEKDYVAMLPLLKKGDYSQFFRMDMNNHILYNLDGKPVVHPLYLTFGSNDYCLPLLIKKLKENSNVKDIKVSEVPYYNRETTGEEELECIVSVSEKDFALWMEQHFDFEWRLKQKLAKGCRPRKNTIYPVSGVCY